MTLPSSNFHGFQQQRQSRDIIKGPRPSPLMINRSSHSIRKPSSTFSEMTTAAAMINPKPPHSHLRHHQQPQQIRKPVIIYTHSPKIIHTKPEDFMALVQKLTGMPRRPKDKKDVVVSGSGTENLESSLSDESIISSIKQEKIGSCDVSNDITSSSSVLADLKYADIPLFTPNSSDFLISPYNRSVFNKQSSADSPFGMLGSLISPSGLEFIRELPEY